MYGHQLFRTLQDILTGVSFGRAQAVVLSEAVKTAEGCRQASTGSGRPGAPQDEALRLGERDVAAVSQGSDAEAPAVAHILIIVADLRIAYTHLHIAQRG